ncbi:MAG TPA: hypothetical protein VF119_06210 [Candidatus Limnocylindrales bacterium]
MFHPDVFKIEYLEDATPTSPAASRGCLVDGCSCKDARIVSHRRAAFFAALARRTGETADRVIAPDPDWAFSTGVSA